MNDKLLPFEFYVESGTPHAVDSFLDQGEWFRFKNIDDFFQDGGFAVDSFEDAYDDAQMQVDDLEQEHKDINKLAKENDWDFDAIIKEMEEFDILEYVEENPDESKEDMVKMLDEMHQQWFNKLFAMRDKNIEIISASKT